jgi:hypothetical protein
VPRRPSDAEVDRVYRVADLVADLAAGRATRSPPVAPHRPHPALSTGPPPSAALPAQHPLPPRPRIVQDPVILGLTRRSRSKLGSRLFTLFFVFVYVVIFVQLIWSLLQS